MIWASLKVMWPSFLIFFFICTFLCYLGWFFLKRTYHHVNFPATLPLVFAFLLTTFHIAKTYITMDQTVRIQNAQTQVNTQQRGVSSIPAADKLKTDFLTNVDALIGNPAQITPESKEMLFKNFGGLFATPDAKKTYLNNIVSLYLCQKAYFEDALKSMKDKKFVKSDLRTRCHNTTGQFFSRERLIPAELAKVDDDVIQKLAEGKPIESNGKQVKFTEADVKARMEAVEKRIEAVKVLFQ